MPSVNKCLIVISGPTAVGKTALAIGLAKALKTVVASADSRQIFKEMVIGTAKPTTEEMQGVKHYFIDHVSIHDQPVYDAAQYEKEAITLLEELFQTNDVVIMAGGSGLYVNAVLNGLDDIPEVPDKIRRQLTNELQEQGLPVLLEELKEKDPLYYEKVHKENPRRVQRALEVIRHTGKPFSDFHSGHAKQRFFRVIHIGLERDREELYERINRRMDLMLQQGLEEEAKTLYPFRELNALQTVGYKEVFDFMEGRYNREEMIEKLKQHSRQYAKRQMTWLKKDDSIKWFHPSEQNELMEYVKVRLNAL
ncbi:MAG TPA: tRNA (adenosine(37)-N6)-dimethylallyltransferase MiaA [Cytophagaceae bacterium]|jgi:tRNA dimethylallyltransferase|nr:tRNA (adenosine(37)-N6)-dimethylallyltransferase MiaA [Cytophagaceae bacterium]